MQNYYISYNLYFRDNIKIDKEINYYINNNSLIENIIIYPLKIEKIFFTIIIDKIIHSLWKKCLL